MTDANGQASFISIFPGWYSGRAPHIHVEILSSSGTSLLVTQIAFPETSFNAVYATEGYNGAPDTSNSKDNVFSDSLSSNMADSVTGNTTDGYTLLKAITV
jgi:protocatechuate 3,4-dioxygenase beta subunit